MGAVLGDCVRAGRIDPRLAAAMDINLSGIAAVVAGCERIKVAPIPFAYTLRLHRAATLSCFLLPFGLDAHHLRLDAMCCTIKINLLDTLGEADLPPSLAPVNGRLT